MMKRGADVDGDGAAAMVGSVDSLPREIFQRVARCLSALDLLRLSHTNHQLFAELLAGNADEWTCRVCGSLLSSATVSDNQLSMSAKKQFFTSWSLKFPGQQTWKTSGKFLAAVLVPRAMRGCLGGDAFSIDVWFALLPSPSRPSLYMGGVLLGVHVPQPGATFVPVAAKHIIHVDAQANLYCSLTDAKPIVARKLELHRWYHVALTVNDASTQRVYLDGKLVDTSGINLGVNWSRRSQITVGNGCFLWDSPGKPPALANGWYGFYGVIDEMRIWQGCLSQELVQQLASGTTEEDLMEDQVEWSLRRHGGDPVGPMTKFRCARPHHRARLEPFSVKQ